MKKIHFLLINDPSTNIILLKIYKYKKNIINYVFINNLVNRDFNRNYKFLIKYLGGPVVAPAAVPGS